MDRQILKKLKEDDRKVLRMLFDKYYPSLVRYAIFHLNETHPAEELVQDLFIYIWEKRMELNISGSLESYLYVSVRNKCLNHLKSKSAKINKLSVSETSVHNLAASSDDILESSELHELIVLAVRELSQKTSLVFNYSRNSGLTHKQIADKLGISVKTVEYHIGTALKSIRDFLERNGYLFVFIMALINLFLTLR